MKIYIGADYRGRDLKNKVKEYLESSNYEVVDFYNDEREINDYTDFTFAVGEKVRDDENSLGILICGSGSGVCIAANKVKGIRCVRAASVQDALLGREHDGANILALGAEITTDFNLVKEIINTFINTPFPTLERRIRRFEQIRKYEESN